MQLVMSQKKYICVCVRVSVREDVELHGTQRTTNIRIAYDVFSVYPHHLTSKSIPAVFIGASFLVFKNL